MSIIPCLILLYNKKACLSKTLKAGIFAFLYYYQQFNCPSAQQSISYLPRQITWSQAMRMASGRMLRSAFAVQTSASLYLHPDDGFRIADPEVSVFP